MTSPNGFDKRRLALNALVSWVGTFAQILAVFFVSPILIRGLGDERYGVWALVDSVLAYLTLFDLGIGAAVVRYVARFDGIKDITGLNRSFSVSICLFSGAGVGVMLVSAVILGPVWPSIPVPSGLRDEAWWQMALLCFNLAVGLPLGVFAAILDGLQQYIPKTIVRIATLILRSLFLILVIRLGGGLFMIASAVTAVAILESLVLALLAFRFLPGLRFSTSLVDGPTMRMIGGYSFNAFLAMIAGRISFQTDSIIIACFLPLPQVTFFILAARVCDHAKNALRAMTQVLTPHVSRLEGLNDLDAIRRVYVTGTRYVLWLITPVQFGIWFFGKSFFRLWIGPDHAERCYPVLVILAIPLSLVLSQSVGARILYGIGRIRMFSRFVMMEAVANLVLSVLLVRPYGIEGVAFGTAAPNILMNCVLVMYVCRELELSVFVYLRRSFVAPWVMGMVTLACYFPFNNHISINTWIQFVLVGSMVTLSYAIPALLIESGAFGFARLLRLTLTHRLGSPAG